MYDPDMQTGDEQAYAARQLWAGCFQAVISSHSREQAGYPFGSVVPYVLDRGGQPLLLLSHLSQHTRNIDTDSRCGFLLVEHGGGDIQQRGRLSALGDMHVVEAVDATEAERYFAHFPQTRMYFDELGFRFYRFSAVRLHWNGGFATARWFDPGRIIQPNPLDGTVEKHIIDHMNTDHVGALMVYLDTLPYRISEGSAVMVGIDREGIALRVADELIRVPLIRPVHSAEDARSVLIEMARR